MDRHRSEVDQKATDLGKTRTKIRQNLKKSMYQSFQQLQLMSPGPKKTHTPIGKNRYQSMNTINEEGAWDKGHYLSLNMSNYNTHKSKSRPSSTQRQGKHNTNKRVKTKKVSLVLSGGPRKAKSKDFDIEAKLQHQTSSTSQIVFKPTEETEMQRMEEDTSKEYQRSSQYSDLEQTAQKQTGDSVFKEK